MPSNDELKALLEDKVKLLAQLNELQAKYDTGCKMLVALQEKTSTETVAMEVEAKRREKAESERDALREQLRQAVGLFESSCCTSGTDAYNWLVGSQTLLTPPLV